MRAIVKAVLAVAIPAATAAAQQDPPVLPPPEIGFRVGIVRISPPSSFGEDITAVVIPGSNFLSPEGVQFTFFVTPRFALQPNLGYLRISGSDNTDSRLFLAIQPEFHVNGAVRSPYVFGHFGFVRETESSGAGSDAESNSVFGGGVGFRRIVRGTLATRYELRFRKVEIISSESSNEIGFMVGIGAIIGKKSSP